MPALSWWKDAQSISDIPVSSGLLCSWIKERYSIALLSSDIQQLFSLVSMLWSLLRLSNLWTLQNKSSSEIEEKQRRELGPNFDLARYDSAKLEDLVAEEEIKSQEIQKTRRWAFHSFGFSSSDWVFLGRRSIDSVVGFLNRNYVWKHLPPICL